MLRLFFAAALAASAAIAAGPPPAPGEAALIPADAGLELKLAPPTADGITRSSRYLTMPDGTRIAIDVWRPRSAPADARLPTILQQTRYWRRVDIRFPFNMFVDPLDHQGILGEVKRAFLARGYAWVDVDTRGSGASFGSRPWDYSPMEIADGATIADWITKQPWSDGQIIPAGASYTGSTAEFALTNNHPALRSAINVSSEFDQYTDILAPGGVPLTFYLDEWGETTKALDENRIPGASFKERLASGGVATVDGDVFGSARHGAVADHADNYDFRELKATVFRDDLTVVGSAATPGRQKAIATAFTMLGQRFGPDFRARGLDLASQHNYAPLLDASGAAQLNVAGWFDGTYANAAFKRFNTLKPGSVRLLIGPWDHTQADISPYGVPGRTRFATIAALLAFADGRTAGRASLLDDAPIHYFTMGEQRWHATKSWPVQNRPTRLYLSDGGRLAAAPQPGEVPVRYLIDFTATTGGQTRYDTLLGHRLRTPYAKRAERDAQLVIHDGAPLAHDMEVTGHPIAHVRLATTATDGAVFAYLEDVWPDGRVTWVTDGQLRLLHRASATYPAATWAAGPPRSYRRADAKPMVPGEAEDIVFELLPTSYLFKAGHRIRLAIAGADKDHFARIPADPAEAPELTIARGGASWVELPVVTR